MHGGGREQRSKPKKGLFKRILASGGEGENMVLGKERVSEIKYL